MLTVALVIGALGYVALLVRSVLQAETEFGQASLLKLGMVTFLPLAVFFAFRLPLLFPFGLYLALIPFDSILAVSSGATLTRFAGIASALALVFRAVLLREVLPPAKSWFAWLAFVSYAGISFIWTSDVPTAQMVFQQIATLFVLMTVLAIYPARPTEFRIALGITIATGVGAAVYAVQLYRSGAVSASENRVLIATTTGIVLDFNTFATCFIMPIAIGLGTAFYSRSLAIRVVSSVSVLVMMAGILVSGSRGGFVAAIAVFAYFLFRSRNRWQVGAFAVAAIGLTAFFPSVVMRFINDPSQAGSGSGRTFIWKTALATLHEHWLFGAGVGSFERTYDASLLKVFQPAFQGWSRPSHSLIVGSVTEFGILGLALVLYCWYASFRETRFIPRGSWLYGVRLASEAALLGLFFQAFFIDPYVIKSYWLAFAFPLLIVHVARASEPPSA